MLIKDCFSDLDTVFIKRDGSILSSDSILKNDIIINDNSLSLVSALNRNISNLYNKLLNKEDKTKIFDCTDIVCNAPQGYILTTDGVGQIPYWIDPVLFSQNLSLVDTISSTKILLDFDTLNETLFENIVNVNINKSILFTDTGSLSFKPLSIPLTTLYTFKLDLTPTKRDILSYGSNHIIFSGIGLSTNYNLFLSTSSGLLQVFDYSIEVINDNTKVVFKDTIDSVFKVYFFKLDINSSLYETTIKKTKLIIDTVILNNDNLQITYSDIEGNGQKITFDLIGSKDLIINYINIDLLTNS